MRLRGSHLLAMLLLTGTVFTVGAVQKSPCANRAWVEHREGGYAHCYSDVTDLYEWEQLAGGRLPYLDACRPSPHPCDEYPVVSMYVMRAAAWVGGNHPDDFAGFYWTNVVLLGMCALATVWCLERLGARTILFAAAPTLLVYGAMNWDLIAVVLATVATYLFLRGRRTGAGVGLGLGTAAKVYPVLMLLPFAADDAGRKDLRGTIRMVAWFAVTWLVVNVPFAIAGGRSWTKTFRFNALRAPEPDTLWRAVTFDHWSMGTLWINMLSFAIPLGATLLIWRVKERREPGFPRWTLAFPLLATFLLANKIWSPQYSLWLLPWFALTATSTIPFVAYQLAELLVFFERFEYFAQVNSHGSGDYRAFAVAVLLRAALLLWCVVVWVRRPTPGLTPAPEAGVPTGAVRPAEPSSLATG